jgi:hypothetical protein
MANVNKERMTVELDGEFVVFLIGMRINKPWKIHKWLPVFLAMPKMIKELQGRPDSGFLGHSMGLPVIVQYWRSFDQLEAYARSRDSIHWPAWTNFYKKIGKSSGDVGIWHETYRVAPGNYEAIYSGMPTFGLGKVGKLLPVKEHRENARERIEALVAQK